MPYFLGLEEPPALLLTTVAEGLPHPDIDEVGSTATTSRS